MSRPHARLSPSAAKRWSTCPGSIGLTEANATRLREIGTLGRETPASISGTDAHTYGELRITSQIHPVASVRAHAAEALGPARKKLSDEAIENAEAYASWVTGFVARAGDIPWGLELSAPLWYEPESVGTADFWAVEGDTLVVVDYKSGRVPVDPVGNLQVTIYLIAIYDLIKAFNPQIRRFRAGIMQPFSSNPREPRWWDVSMPMLERMREIIDAAVFEVKNPVAGNPRLVPSDEGCRFCPAKAICPAMNEVIEEFAAAATTEEITALPPERLVDLFKKAKLVESFVKDLKEFLPRMPEDWLEDQGIRVVRASRRGWNEDKIDELADELWARGVDLYRKVAKTPAMIEKEEGLSGLDEWIETTDIAPSCQVRQSKPTGFKTSKTRK